MAYQGFYETAKALLDGGANPNILDSSGHPPIREAIFNGKKQVVELLLDRGADVNIRMSKGETPLHTALVAEEQEIAQLLVDRGANADAPNELGITPRQLGDFKKLKAAGWNQIDPSSGADLTRNLRNLSEGGLEAFGSLLPWMVEQHLAQGKITAQRATELRSKINDYEEAKKLPLEIRTVRMREISAELLALIQDSGNLM